MMVGYDRLWSKHRWRSGGGTRRRSTKDDLCLDGRCKSHPGHLQSPGVCSLCLNEKLSQIQRSLSSRPPRAGSSVASRASSISSSLSSFYSCSSATLASSPSRTHGPDRRVPGVKGRGRRSRGRFGFGFPGRNRTKASSSSDAAVAEDDRIHEDDHVGGSKKRSRCWWKLVHPGSKEAAPAAARRLVM
ncbi:hypothetical protein MLD38_034796 [Melastoma candidum]|uniref:Uncharacterized protein n=1 Tax=Melastoma candidum TaxID=119954 RepID=A0ACB9MBM2_9MYRT|nr:hypothetical protein MLD38_034796 [Melastoma candidum]